MMNGLQFLAHLQGKLKPDESKVQKALKEFGEKFPCGILSVTPDRLSVRVQVKQDPKNKLVFCMQCGNPLTDRANQYFKNGKWIHKARKDNMSNYECSHCAPGVGGQPLLAMRGTAQDVKPEDLN